MKSLVGRGILLILPLIILFNPPVKAENNHGEEAIYSVKYLNYTNDFNVYLQGDSIFIQLEDIISFFKIYYKTNDNQRFDGYVNTRDSSYFIDFNTKEYKDISGKINLLTDDSWFATDLQVYVRTDLISKIFKIRLQPYFNDLVINVYSNYELPIVRLSRIAYTSNNFRKKVNNEVFGPLISGTSFKLLNGGILDYSFGNSFSNNSQSYSLGGNVGLEVLGGEYQYGINAYSYLNKINYQDRMRWSYRLDNNVLSMISIGDLTNQMYRSSGSHGYRKNSINLRGMQISNEKVNMPLNFSNYVIEDNIGPDWNVELYMDNQLYDVKRTDLTGYYRFEIPLSYGITNIKVKYYGPKGEFINEEKVLDIPPELLKPGEVKYTISAGEDNMSHHRLLDGSGFLGITKWWTTSFSATKIDTANSINMVGQSAINLFNNLMVNLTATNNGVYEGGLRIAKPSLGSWEIVYTAYDQSYNNLFIQTKSAIQLISTLNNPFTLPITLNLNGTRNQNKTTNSNYFNTSLVFNIASINFIFRHDLSINDYQGKFSQGMQSLNTNISYYLTEPPDFISFLNGTRFSSTLDLNISTMKMNNLSLVIDQKITQDIYFTTNINYYVFNKRFAIQFGLNANLPFVRSRLTSNYNQGNPMSISEDINGSLEFDSQNMKFNFLNSIGTNNNFGRSSAAIRFYNDKNYNNIYDEGDDLIKDADFDVSNNTINKSSNDGYRILSNLIPGEKYNINVKQESFPNPSMIPDLLEFSFIAEPYSYKAIDIACHQGGTIEGNIFRIKDKTKNGQSGIKVHIESIDNKFSTIVSVFSDGSYFFSGLPVGDYKAYVDSLQVKILSSISDPPVKEFSVKKSADGDYIGNINFELSDNDSIIKLKIEKDSLDNLKKSVDSLKIKNTNKISESPASNQKPADKHIITQSELKTTFYFADTKTITLDNKSQSDLDKIASYLKDNPDVKLNIEGHTDSFSPKADEQLVISEQRAKAIKDYLVNNKGINEKRLASVGKGALNPKADNTTIKKRKLNRRAEITFYTNKDSNGDSFGKK